VWCLFVYPSVCRVPRPNSRTGKRLAHRNGNPLTYLEVKWSKVKVTRPINAETESVISSEWEGLRTVHRWSTKTRITTNAMTSKVAKSCSASCSASDTCCPISQQRSPRNTKIGRKVAHPTSNNVHHSQGQKIRGQGHQAN